MDVWFWVFACLCLHTTCVAAANFVRLLHTTFVRLIHTTFVRFFTASHVLHTTNVRLRAPRVHTPRVRASRVHTVCVHTARVRLIHTTFVRYFLLDAVVACNGLDLRLHKSSLSGVQRPQPRIVGNVAPEQPYEPVFD